MSQRIGQSQQNSLTGSESLRNPMETVCLQMVAISPGDVQFHALQTLVQSSKIFSDSGRTLSCSAHW